MSEGQKRGLGLKSLVVGSAGIIAGCAMAQYSHIVLNSSTLAASWFPLAAAFLFLVLLFLINPLLRSIHPKLELDRIDLTIVFVMMFVSIPMSTMGLVASLLSFMAAPAFYSTPGNQYWTRVGEHLPSWLFPDDARAIVWYWEGAPVGQSIPWGAWIMPLLTWGIFIAAMLGVFIALVSMLRKQWVENERLIFPMMEVPSLLMEDFEKGTRIPPIMRNRLFWIGFVLPVIVFGTQLAHNIRPTIPELKIFGAAVTFIQPSETWTRMQVYIFPLFIGFFYLVKRDVLMSIWVFGIVAYVQVNLAKSFGYSAGTRAVYEEMSNPMIAWQNLGAALMFALVGLYMARHHLASVFRKAFTGDPSIDDANELMRYRSSVTLFILCLTTILVFCVKMGMSLGFAMIVIATFLLVQLAITRYVIEGGVVMARPSAPAIMMPMVLFGIGNMPVEVFGALVALITVIHDNRSGFMPHFANSAKLVEGLSLKRGTLVRVTVYSLFLGIVFAVFFTLVNVYDIGASNSEGWNIKNAGHSGMRGMVSAANNLQKPDGQRLLWLGVGATVMALLSIGRYMFSWWPLHPIGFPASMGITGVHYMLASSFIAWIAKTILLRLGGVPLYNKGKPFFIGLLVGHLVIIGIGFFVDLYFGPPGTVLYRA